MDIQPTQTQNVVPAPASPSGVPGITETEELSQDQMRTNLGDMMSKINNKYQGFSANKFSLENNTKEQKNQILREIFDLLQKAGVDPSNIEQVREFLDKVKIKNPELYQQIVAILDSLMTEENIPEGNLGQEQQPSNMNINNNESPQENI